DVTTDPRLDALKEGAHAHNIELSIYRIARVEEVVAAIDMAQASGATALNVCRRRCSGVIASSLGTVSPRCTCRRSIHFPKRRRKAALQPTDRALMISF